MANKYKKGGTAIGFKNVGGGLQIGERRLTEQRKRETDAIRLAKEQAKEASNINIAGLSSKAKFEEGVLAVTHKLRGEQRAHERGAWEKHYETQIAKLEGEAKELGKRAQEAKELAPQLGKNLGKLAQGTLNFADRLKGEAEWKSLKASGFLDEWRDGFVNTHYNLNHDITKDVIELSKLDPAGANALQKNTIQVSSYWAQQKLLAWVKDNKDSIRSDILENFEKARGDILPGQGPLKAGLLTDKTKDYKYQEHNAIEVMDAGARALLRRFGIDEGSATGIEIIDELNKWGAQDKNKLYLGRKVTETKTDITELGDLYLAAVKNNRPKEEQELLFNNLVARYHNGYFQNESGRINDPTKGERYNWGDASIEAAKEIIDRRIEKLTTPEAVWQLFEGYKVPGSKELLTEKHLKRFNEEVIPHWMSKKNKLDDDAGKLQDAKGVGLKKSIQSQLDEIDGPLNIQQRVKLNKEIEGFDTTDKRKKEALALLDYDSSDYDDHGNWVNFLEAIESSDEKTWMGIYSRLSPQLKERAQDNLKVFTDLKQALPSVIIGSGQNKKVLVGYEAFLHKNHQHIKTKDKGKSYLGSNLSDTGNALNYMYNDKVLDIFTSSADSGVSSAVRLEKAYKLVNADLDKGVEAEVSIDPDTKEKTYLPMGRKNWDGLDPNHWANFITPTGGIAGVTVKANEYYNLNQVDKNEAYKQDKQNLEAFDDIKIIPENNQKPIPYKKGTIKNGLSEGYINLESVMQSSRLIPSNDWLMLKNQAEIFAANGKRGPLDQPGYSSDFSLKTQPWYPLLIEVSEVTGKSPTFLVNEELKRRGAKVGFIEDGLDAAYLNNDGKPVKERNVWGYNIYNSIKSQGLLPLSRDVQLYTQGLNPEEIFSEKSGVTITQTDQGIVFSNPKGAIENGYVGAGSPITIDQAKSLFLIDQDVDEGDLSSDRTPDKGWVNTFTYDPSTDQRVINHLKDVQKRKEKLRRSIADSYKYANPGQYLF